MFVFSIIIPHKNTPCKLQRCLDSIPIKDDIQIIVVDDNSNPQIVDFDNFPGKNIPTVELYFTKENKGAGFARNIGIQHAEGEWVIFADADDYFTPTAFNVFMSKKNSSADIIFSCMDGIIEATGEHSTRGDFYRKLVQDYLTDSSSGNESVIRRDFQSPCCKMIRRNLIIDNHIQFSEVIAGNDAIFSTKVGHYARKIDAINEITYIVTESKNSLTKRCDFEAFKSRFEEDLKINQFFRNHGKKNQQFDIYNNIILSEQLYGKKEKKELILLALSYKEPILLILLKHHHFTKKIKRNIKSILRK